MKKSIVLVLLIAFAALGQSPADSVNVNLTQTITLSPSYSCRPVDEFRKGYERTALFLSAAMKRLNSPDLLFNGACKSTDYFESATHGANDSLVADLRDRITPEPGHSHHLTGNPNKLPSQNSALNGAHQS